MQTYLIHGLIILVLITGCGNSASQALPPEFANFPLYPDAQAVQYDNAEGALTFTVTGSIDDLTRWYTEKLGQNGWQPHEGFRSYGEAPSFPEFITFQRSQPTAESDGIGVNIYMNPNGNKVDVLVLSFTYLQSAPSQNG